MARLRKISAANYTVLRHIIEDQRLAGMSLQRRVRYAMNTSSEDPRKAMAGTRANRWMDHL